MKKLILIALFLTTTLGFSQERKAAKMMTTPEERAGLQLKKLKTDLDLNEKQESKLKVIIVEQIKAFDAIKAEIKKKRAAGEKPSKEDIEKAKNLRDQNEVKLEEELKKILTKEQFKKFETLKAERKAAMLEKKKEKNEANQDDMQDKTK